MGFFSESSLIGKGAVSKIPKCGACGLYKQCQSPKMPVNGQGRKGILICAEAPGAEEDEANKPLVGRAGRHLEQHLQRVGINLRRDCWITNALICRPPSNKIPDDKMIDYCRPNLFNAIEKLQPDIILCLGGPAIKSLIGHIWKEDIGQVARWVGFQIPSQKPNCWICPTYHPSYLQNDPVLELHFHHHLEAASQLSGKPWNKLPQYEKQVQVVLGPSDAATRLKDLYESGPKLVALDYETTMLKPDSKDARIVCCAISDGKTTLAYPWHGPTVKWTNKILQDKNIGKTAHNLKFERGWNGGNNWVWCSMVNAHILDNRRMITGLKFQSFVNFGLPIYNEHIEPFLKAKGGNIQNRVKEVELSELCLYCGLDALICHKLTVKQMGEVGRLS